MVCATHKELTRLELTRDPHTSTSPPPVPSVSRVFRSDCKQQVDTFEVFIKNDCMRYSHYDSIVMLMYLETTVFTRILNYSTRIYECIQEATTIYERK